MNQNLQMLLERINKASQKCGISPNSIEIVAASKTRDIKTILEYAGYDEIAAFGENRAQELISKYDESVTWDFIGRLQSNKLKYLVDKVRLIQSVDRLSLVAEIDRLASKLKKKQGILIEINGGNEECKGGISAKDALDFCKSIEGYSNVELKGLMAVMPYNRTEDELKNLFSEVKTTFDRISAQIKGFKYLSMGMSEDFELAIECGSNMIRPGRVLFD